MDISPTSNATATATTGGVKTPEAETETPSRIQPGKPLIFTNGVLKRHHPLHHHHHHHPPPQAVVITYKECLKNHAASLGGHAVDGCGEFMPSPTATPTDPTSLKCAACGCHRNFHRRDPEEPPLPPSTPSAQHVIEYRPHHRHHPPPPPLPPPHGGDNSSPNSPSPPPISSSYYPSAPHMLLALSSGGLSGHPQENNPSINAMAGNPNGRKRFRTKFTPDQKQRMQEFAEKVGWKFQKKDEETISDFCNEVGVERGVLKVWMHNNKAVFGRKEINNGNGIANGSNNGLHTTTTADHHHNHHQNDNSVGPHVVATNGSSSSS